MKIKISIGDGEYIETDAFERNPSLSPYGDGLKIAQKFLNYTPVPRTPMPDNVKQLALLIATIIQGEHRYITKSLHTKLSP